MQSSQLRSSACSSKCGVSRHQAVARPSSSSQHVRCQRLNTRLCAWPKPKDAIATGTYSASDDSEPDVPSGGWWTKNSAPNMKDVVGIQQLVDELADAGDKLVIVEFFAPWCNACKALYPKLCRLMGEHQDDILFLKVSFDGNKDVCKTMGIKVLPMFHFYRGAEGRVDQFTCTVSKLDRFKEALEKYSAAFCSLEEPPGIQEYPDVKPHANDHSNGYDTSHDRPTKLQADMWE